MRSLDLEISQNDHMGVAFRNVSVYGYSSQTDYQKTFINYPLSYLERFLAFLRRRPKSRIDILENIEGVVQNGQMLLVLGRPGAGCTSLLKTLAGQTHGFHVDVGTMINYQGEYVRDLVQKCLTGAGICPAEMYTRMRGRCVYQAEFDVHYPLLSVRQTLQFAAKARPSQDAVSMKGSSRDAAADDAVEVIAASLGLTQALDTKVGNDFVPGISGGERKRASIAVRNHIPVSKRPTLRLDRKYLRGKARFIAGTIVQEGLTVPMRCNS